MCAGGMMLCQKARTHTQESAHFRNCKQCSPSLAGENTAKTYLEGQRQKRINQLMHIKSGESDDADEMHLFLILLLFLIHLLISILISI